MEVCAKCHERDKNPIKCYSALDSHPVFGPLRAPKDTCDICNRKGVKTYYCYHYREYMVGR